MAYLDDLRKLLKDARNAAGVVERRVDTALGAYEAFLGGGPLVMLRLRDDGVWLVTWRTPDDDLASPWHAETRQTREEAMTLAGELTKAAETLFRQTGSNLQSSEGWQPTLERLEEVKAWMAWTPKH